jgi:uncharacterized protein (DUF2461 family)
MNNALNATAVNSLDLFRISRSKKVVDLSPNTIRKLHRECGLRIYYSGGASWVSKSELEALIRRTANIQPNRRRKSLSARDKKSLHL